MIKKKSSDQLYDQNTVPSEAYKTIKTKSDINDQKFLKKINLLYENKSKRTHIGNKMSIIGNFCFDKTDPYIIIRNLREDIEEKKYENRQLQNGIYNPIDQRREAEEKTRSFGVELDSMKNQLDIIQQVVDKR